MSDDVHGKICSGQIRVMPNVREFVSAKEILFENGEKVEVDDVILATGYYFSFPFLEGGKLIPVEKNNVRVYKNMFPAKEAHKNTLALIGLLQPIGLEILNFEKAEF